MKDLWLDDALGERRVSPEDLPLSVGGPGASIVVPGTRAGEVRARVAVAGGRLAITPEPGAGADALDGIELALESRDGREVIVVRHGGVANVTKPPADGGLPAGAADAEGDRIAIAVVDYEPRRRNLPRAPAAARG